MRETCGLTGSVLRLGRACEGARRTGICLKTLVPTHLHCSQDSGPEVWVRRQVVEIPGSLKLTFLFPIQCASQPSWESIEIHIGNSDYCCIVDRDQS